MARDLSFFITLSFMSDSFYLRASLDTLLLSGSILRVFERGYARDMESEKKQPFAPNLRDLFTNHENILYNWHKGGDSHGA